MSSQAPAPTIRTMVEGRKTSGCLEGLLRWELWVQRLLADFLPVDKITRLMPACRTGTLKFSNNPSGLWVAFR